MESTRIPNSTKTMNKYQQQDNQFLNNFSFYSSIAMTCSLLCFCSSPLWYPSLKTSITVFIFVSLPNLKTLLFNPKCLFIVCNAIVVFLIGESKFVSSKTSPVTELYDECIKRSKTYQTIPISDLVVEKEVKLESADLIEEKVKMETIKSEEEREMELVVSEEEGIEGEEEEKGLPAEELNRRVEEFISRMKRQRMVEAGLLVSSTTTTTSVY